MLARRVAAQQAGASQQHPTRSWPTAARAAAGGRRRRDEHGGRARAHRLQRRAGCRCAAARPRGAGGGDVRVDVGGAAHGGRPGHAARRRHGRRPAAALPAAVGLLPRGARRDLRLGRSSAGASGSCSPASRRSSATASPTRGAAIRGGAARRACRCRSQPPPRPRRVRLLWKIVEAELPRLALLDGPKATRKLAPKVLGSTNRAPLLLAAGQPLPPDAEAAQFAACLRDLRRTMGVPLLALTLKRPLDGTAAANGGANGHGNVLLPGGNRRCSIVAYDGGEVSTAAAPVEHFPVQPLGGGDAWLAGFVHAAIELGVEAMPWQQQAVRRRWRRRLQGLSTMPPWRPLAARSRASPTSPPNSSSRPSARAGATARLPPAGAPAAPAAAAVAKANGGNGATTRATWRRDWRSGLVAVVMMTTRRQPSRSRAARRRRRWAWSRWCGRPPPQALRRICAMRDPSLLVSAGTVLSTEQAAPPSTPERASSSRRLQSSD